MIHVTNNLRVSQEALGRMTRIVCSLCDKRFSFNEVQEQIGMGLEWRLVVTTVRFICPECVQDLDNKK